MWDNYEHNTQLVSMFISGMTAGVLLSTLIVWLMLR